MSDVRALLRTKRQEARVSHPLASYSSSGQLRCTACGTLVRQAAAWNGHIGSKAHRINVTKLKIAEQAEQLVTESAGSKRKSAVEDVEVGDNDAVTPHPKRAKVAVGLPDNFFSDPSRLVTLQASDDDDGDSNPIVQPSVADEEWVRFQQAILQAPSADDRRATFDNATIIAEPVLSDEVSEGFPSVFAQSQVGEGITVASESNEEELRRQKELEERELIMDRLMDEERAQEEADAKVSMLRSKLDALKRRRDLAKAARTNKT